MEHKAESQVRTTLWVWSLVAILVAIVVLLVSSRKSAQDLPGKRESNSAGSVVSQTNEEGDRIRRGIRAARFSSVAVTNAEQMVTNKLNQFARGRREIARKMAHTNGVALLPEMEQFFDAVEGQRWDEMRALYESLLERRKQEDVDVKLLPVWPALLETLGVAEAVQKWPAQKLIDYGNAILDSLRPGMIYVGGTDPGRYIPTLLSETADGERHVVLTQNAFADRTYLDYANSLYGDRLTALTKDDSDRAFHDYLSDARKRFEHDRDFPNEPKQVRPGEDIRFTDNRVQVSGQVAVMAINERLLQMLMDKNPDASFAIQQSTPFTSMFDDARPLGPIMELRAHAEQNALTRERAAESADYWRDAARQLFAGADAMSEPGTRDAFAKLAADQAALLLHHGYAREAEQALRSATEIAPASGDAVFRYVSVLVEQKRFEEAMRVTESAVAADRDKQHDFERLSQELERLRQQSAN